MAMGVHTAGSKGRGRRGTAGRRAPMAEINVTPFVDVMLVLLIIFMVTAPLLTAGVPVDLPDSNAKPLDQEQRPPVQISMNAAGELFVDDDEIAEDELSARLEAIAEAQGDNPRTINLRADRGLDYGRVMRVMGDLNRAGLNRVALVTTESVTTRGDASETVTAGSDDGN